MAPIARYRVSNSHPVVEFEMERTPASAVAQRFIKVNGTRLYYLGITCDTCAYLFEKRGYEYRLSPAEIGSRLQAGTNLLASDLLQAVSRLLESGKYGVVVTRFVPRPTGPCDPDDYFAHESVAFFGLDPATGVPDNPRVRYWRAGESVLPDGLGAKRIRVTKTGDRLPSPQLFFHLLAPMEPPHVLDRDRIDHFRRELGAGARPAALGVSVLDVRAKAVAPGPAADDGWMDATAWCLTTLLLDGHHKVQAAAEAGEPIQLLTFVSRAASVAEDVDVDVVLDELDRWSTSTAPS
jgi:hypothetical protein